MEGCRWGGQNLQLKEVQRLMKKKNFVINGVVITLKANCARMSDAGPCQHKHRDLLFVTDCQKRTGRVLARGWPTFRGIVVKSPSTPTAIAIVTPSWF